MLNMLTKIGRLHLSRVPSKQPGLETPWSVSSSYQQVAAVVVKSLSVFVLMQSMMQDFPLVYLYSTLATVTSAFYTILLPVSV